MRVALQVGALMFTLVSGFYELGVLDTLGSPDSQREVHAFEDAFPPPPNWP